MSNSIQIVTGPIGSGKTTWLMQWIASRQDVSGILTPVIDGKRYFFDIAAREQFPMEAAVDETSVLNIGRYIFSAAAFEKANQVIFSALRSSPDHLIIDEVGPLELEGKGLYKAVKQSVDKEKLNLILVVRNGLATEVISFFGLKDVIIIDKEELP